MLSRVCNFRVPSWLRIHLARHNPDSRTSRPRAVRIEADDRAGIERLLRYCAHLSPAEARRAALVTLGGVERTKERVRDARWTKWLEDLVADVRYAVRFLLRTPTFTVVAVLTLGLGIGATTAIFSVVDGVLIRPLPYRDADRIVTVRLGLRPSTHVPGDFPLSESDIRFFANNNRAFEAFTGYLPDLSQYALTGDGAPQELEVAHVAVGVFDLLGVRPELGRLPTQQEGSLGMGSRGKSARTPVLLLSDRLWRTRFGSDPTIIGTTLTLKGLAYEVIGVMPAGYDFPNPRVDAWIPLRLEPSSPDWGRHYLTGLARLKAGETVSAAEADAHRLISRFTDAGYSKEWLEKVFDGSAHIVPLKETVVEHAKLPLLILMGTVGLVLLIACGNVANLLLVRAEGRTRETAVRIALGSGRRRLIQHQVMESVLLALAGGAVGITLAYVGTRILVSLAPASLPRLGDIGIHSAVLWFTIAVSLSSGLLIGLLPALRLSARTSLAALRNASRGHTAGRERHRIRSTLVVTEVALALILVVGAGLLVRTFAALHEVAPGFDADHVLTFRVNPEQERHGGNAAGLVRFYDRLVQRLDAIPGVVAAGGITELPLTGGVGYEAPYIEEFPPPMGEMKPVFKMRVVTPGYFRAMRIPVLEGRPFEPGDGSSSPGAIIISNSLERRYWPGGNALGKGIALDEKLHKEAAVVGVVEDVHDTGLDAAADAMLYYPASDSMFVLGPMSMVVRTRVDPSSIVPDVRRVVAQLDADLPVTNVRAMSDIVAASMSRTTFTMYLLALAALIALFLGAVGIYGIVSYTVRQRTAEIGIRVALGAEPRRVRRTVVHEGLALAVAGILIGLVAAAALGRTLASLLFGVSPLDPVTLIGGSTLFLIVAGLASAIPAGRATLISPAEALRAE